MTRIQLHSTEVQVTIVSLRRELDEARASEEAARLQITRMMDEQLIQNQTIEALRRQVESSNTSAQQARHYYVLIRSNSHGCLRLVLLPVEQGMSLVSLL